MTPDDIATIKRMAGQRSAQEIARMIGRARETVARYMAAAGLPAYHPARRAMTRRDRLMLGAAGLHAPEPDGR